MPPPRRAPCPATPWGPANLPADVARVRRGTAQILADLSAAVDEISGELLALADEIDNSGVVIEVDHGGDSADSLVIELEAIRAAAG